MQLVEPANPNGLPRYTKWRLKDIADALNETALKDIQPGQVCARPLRESDLEEEFMETVLSDEHISDAQIGSKGESNSGNNNNSDGFSTADEMVGSI